MQERKPVVLVSAGSVVDNLLKVPRVLAQILSYQVVCTVLEAPVNRNLTPTTNFLESVERRLRFVWRALGGCSWPAQVDSEICTPVTLVDPRQSFPPSILANFRSLAFQLNKHRTPAAKEGF